MKRWVIAASAALAASLVVAQDGAAPAAPAPTEVTAPEAAPTPPSETVPTAPVEVAPSPTIPSETPPPVAETPPPPAAAPVAEAPPPILPDPAPVVVEAPPAPAAGGCENAGTPKRRVVLSWNGQSDRNSFNLSVQASHAGLARGAAKHFVALGNGESPTSPARVPTGGSLTPDVGRADTAGWLAIADKVKADLAAAKAADPTFKPSDYELDIMVTNHGVIITGPLRNGVRSRSYGIQSMDAGRIVDPGYIQDFARRLPAGIRVKSIFGQCYGGDTQDQFLATWRERARAEGFSEGCACGVALAAPGAASSAALADGEANWEGRMAAYSGDKKTNLLEMNWKLLISADPGVTPSWDLSAQDRGTGPVENGGLTASERYMRRAILRSTGSIWSQDDLERNAKQVLRTALAKPQARGLEDPVHARAAFKASRVLRRKVLAEELGVPNDATLEANVQRAADYDSRYRRYRARIEGSRQDENRKVDEYNDYLENGFRPKLAAHNAAIDDYNRFNRSHVRFDGSAASQEALAEYERTNTRLATTRTELDAARAELDRRKGELESARLARRTLGTEQSRVLAAKLLARERLESAFLANASTREIEEFEKLRQCELQTFGPGPAPAATGTPARSH